MGRIIDNPYDGLPLNDKNIGNYILSSELNIGEVEIKEVKELNVQPFLQKDFTELEQDCVFTSIVTCVHYFYPEVAPQDIYNVAVAIYQREFPSFQKIEGVVPFVIKHVYSEVYKFFKLHYYSIKSRYVNRIGFNYNTIKQQIDQGIPVIVSMYNDGRQFYKNHTVTAIGYMGFQMDNLDPFMEHIKPKKERNVLMVYDNWSTEIRYVDLKEVSSISLIVF